MTIGYMLVDENAKPPRRGSDLAAGFDLTAVSVRQFRPSVLEYDTGVALDIPPGMVGLVYPRSSISLKDMDLCNSVGVIDPDYTGTIKLRFQVWGDNVYKVGERIGQIVFVPFDDDVRSVNEIKATERGEGGFGSTGE